MRIVIEEWREGWERDFLAFKPKILAVAPAGSTLHHIGSTAVPGLAAKDVIDMQLSVAELSSVDTTAIEQAGFVHKAGLVDHCPPGLDLDDVELTKLFFKSTGRAANLHIREKGRFNQRFALVCRDYLRAHPVAANAYQQIKTRLAAYFPDDEDAYYAIKDPVFDIIVEGANAWSATAGWSDPSGD